MYFAIRAWAAVIFFASFDTAVVPGARLVMIF